MRIFGHADLIACTLLTMLTTVAVVAYPEVSPPVRTFLGLAVVLFAPGYTLQALLFPRERDVDVVERLVLALSLSAATAIGVTLLLTVLDQSIGVASTAWTLATFVTLVSFAAYVRRRAVPKDERFAFGASRPGFGRTLALIGLSCLAVGGVVGLASWLQPQALETEFWVLGQGGGLEDYPRALRTAEPFELTFGVTNHDDEAASYLLSIPFGDNTDVELGSVQPGETLEFAVELRAPEIEGCAKLDFALLRSDDASPYRTLHLFVPVNDQANPRYGAEGGCR